jgi:hypothetical protein
MERPKKLSKEAEAYIDYLECKLKKYSAQTVVITSYHGLRKTINDINNILLNGMEMEVPVLGEDGEVTYKKEIVPVVSSKSLASKDEKTFDRIQKFIDKLGFYNTELKEMEEQISPEDINEQDYASGYEEVMAKINGE